MKKTLGYRNQVQMAHIILAMTFCFLVASGASAAGDEDVTAGHEYSKGVKRCMTCHKAGKALPAHEIFLTPMGVSANPGTRYRGLLRLCHISA